MFEITKLEDSSSLPSLCYTDSNYWNVDLQKILPHTWQYVGPSHSIKEPGQVQTTTLLGKPVIIVRQDQTLRAFYNVCRHRGGPLVTQNGHYKRLQCQYHGWTYALDGTLVGTPHMQLANNFDKSQCPLKSLQVKEWNGMVFLSAHKSPIIDFSSLTQGIDSRIAPLKLDHLQFAKRVEYPVSCNWKIYIDNFLEGYHVPFVHPELNKVLQFSDYTTELSDHYSLQHSPLSSSENAYSSDGGHAFYYFLYPNIMLNILPGRLQVNSVVPETVSTCRVIFDYFYDTQDEALLAEKFAKDTAFSDLVQKEDIAICEILQQNMLSGVYEAGRLSPKFESALHHFQNFLREHYNKHLSDI